MKKILSVLLVLSMLLSASAALAEGMGVQVIGGSETETEPVSLDDIKLNVLTTIEGYGDFTFTSIDYQNRLRSYTSGSNGNAKGYDSGADAEYVILRADITNTSLNSHDFLSDCTVIVVFDDRYEYQGWYYQYNYNNISGIYSYAEFSDRENVGYTDSQTFVIDPADNYPIDPMYTGHFCFGCTLPNAVVNSKAPLKMIITIDGNELTYNIRK